MSPTMRPPPQRTAPGDGPDPEQLPAELIDLRQRVQALPPWIRAELEPIVEEALEEARFRGRVLIVAREALERLRLDLALTRFDLDVTRQEREELCRRLRAWSQGN